MVLAVPGLYVLAHYRVGVRLGQRVLPRRVINAGWEDFDKDHICLVPMCWAFDASPCPLEFRTDTPTYRIRAAFASQTLMQGASRS